MYRFVFVFLLILTFSSASAMADEEAKVQQAFQTYRKALLDQNGKAAWEVVDSHTQEYYEDIAKDCLSLKREDLVRLDMLTKFMILRIRLEFREEQLKTFNGAKIFILGVEKGWISKSTVQQLKRMDKVTIDRNFAQGYIAQAPDIPVFYFIREEDGWKVALWQSFEIGNISLRQMAKENGMSEDEYIKAMLEQVSKYQVEMNAFLTGH